MVTAATAMLQLPCATTSGQRAPFIDALFTATSAVCVTGLSTVDTANYWSQFGETVIVVAIKLGGLGVISVASLMTLAVSRRLGLRQRLLAASETKTLSVRDIRHLLMSIFMFSAIIESVLAAVMFPRFVEIDGNIRSALWHAVAYSISSFNNAGFAFHHGGLPPGSTREWQICLPLCVGVFVGALGFPVQRQIALNWRRPRQWDLHTRLTLTTTFVLLAATFVFLAIWEWNNTATLGSLSTSERILCLTFMSVMPRTGGFELIKTSALTPSSVMTIDAMMFVGGGSSSTAGGIKVTTLAVLVLAAVAEARGERDVEYGRRRVPVASVRVAITVLFAAAFVIWLGTLLLLHMTELPEDQALFEVVSAFSTVGLSTGITADLPTEAKYLIALLMFLGRTGLMTLAAAVAARTRTTDVRYPEESPIIG